MSQPAYPQPPQGGFPPAQPALKKKPLWKRWWFWGALVVVLAIIGAANGGPEDPSSGASSASTPTQAPASESQSAAQSSSQAPASTTAPKAKSAGLGTPVRDGKFEFTVTNVDCSKTTIGDNPYLTKKAQGVFCIVALHVANIGNKAQTFDAGSQEAFDAQDRKFSADSSAAMYLGDQGNSFLEELNPGNAVDGQLVYDVPAGTQLTEIELHDSPFSGGVKVALS